MQTPWTRSINWTAFGSSRRVSIARLASICGLTAPIFFGTGVALVGMLQPDYLPLADTVSKMGRVGRLYDSVANGMLVITGILITIFAQGLPILNPRSRKMLLARNFMVGFGLFGLTGAGLFPCDEICAGMSFANILHTLPVAIGFASLQLALLELSRVAERDSYWLGIPKSSKVLVWAGLFTTLFYFLGRWQIFPPLDAYTGLSEKMYLAFLLIFIFVVAKRLYQRSSLLSA